MSNKGSQGTVAERKLIQLQNNKENQIDTMGQGYGKNQILDAAFLLQVGNVSNSLKECVAILGIKP